MTCTAHGRRGCNVCGVVDRTTGERYKVDERNYDLHVLPEFEGEREHVTSTSCWCGPTRDVAEPRVVVHQRKVGA